jgi:dipeptidyl aminopeptidase/acylaminoacyl peptidase
MVLWAYPHSVIDGADARLSSYLDRYPSFDRAFRQFFLLRGYAVLDDVSMPIVGRDSDANDTFIEQVVANAEAAIAAAAATGQIDPDRVGVAGHSYGAFMTANLLAHSDLFRAGIALSGAYNRTLTPFGFQTERRTIWDAPDTYLAMSPFMFANRIEAPLLLVHGLLDDNAGTAPLQSMQFYEAIRGTGGQAELLLLPYEGHEYRARESVLDTAARMLSWFDSYLQSDIFAADTKETGALLRP